MYRPGCGRGCGRWPVASSARTCGHGARSPADVFPVGLPGRALEAPLRVARTHRRRAPVLTLLLDALPAPANPRPATPGSPAGAPRVPTPGSLYE
jgi:hypothetical protein